MEEVGRGRAGGPFPMSGKLLRKLTETKSEGDKRVQEGNLHRSMEKMMRKRMMEGEKREGGEGLQRYM